MTKQNNFFIPKIVFLLGEEDMPYIHRLEECVKGTTCKVYTGEIITLTDIIQKAKKHNFNCFVTTRIDVLHKLLPEGNQKKTAKISNYAGSLISFSGIEFLIIDPLKQLITVPYGKFLTTRYISKLTERTKWYKQAAFSWKEIRTVQDYDEAVTWLKQCDIIGVDTETLPPVCIDMVGYCGKKLGTNESKTYIISVDAIEKLYWMRNINALSIPKVLQNGNYDNAYFFAYRAPLTAYYYDTINAFHSWYSELPKDLGSITAFFVRDVMYWKDLANAGDRNDKLRYCCLDCYGTVESFCAWILEAPEYAKKNYVTEFTQVPICHMMDMTGIKRNEERLKEVNKYLTNKQEAILTWLEKVVCPGFNPSSHVQVKALLKGLTGKVQDSSEESVLKEISYLHPVNEIIIGKILEYRGLRKLTSTYVPVDDKAKEFRGRILFSIKPHATDTSRKASTEHAFWCGLNIQNVPRDDEDAGLVKETLEADEGFELYEADFAQAEARGVAYKSGDDRLLETVESSRDFHALNASAFFGVPYEKIYRDGEVLIVDGVEVYVKAKTLDKKLRDLAKRTNHGANYNMGPAVMLETMGSRLVRDAQKALNLPKNWALLDVTKYLLAVYMRTYPRVKTTYYEKIKKDVKTTKLLIGDTGLTRYCFGDISNKMALNSYVAHVTQSLNAQLLDRAVLAVFNTLAFNPHFKLIAQIHDSLLFQVRMGHEQLAEQVKKLMTFSVPITDCKGVTRNMLVPVDLKKLGRTWRGND